MFTFKTVDFQDVNTKSFVLSFPNGTSEQFQIGESIYVDRKYYTIVGVESEPQEQYRKYLVE